MGRTIITSDGKFEWDEDKNAKNVEKHGIDFNFAKRVFDDEDKIEEYDDFHSTYNEQRYMVAGWYKSSERAKHPHPKKLKVECSLDEDIIQWLKRKTSDDEEFHMYINYYLRKIMNNGLDKTL